MLTEILAGGYTDALFRCLSRYLPTPAADCFLQAKTFAGCVRRLTVWLRNQHIEINRLGAVKIFGKNSKLGRMPMSSRSRQIAELARQRMLASMTARQSNTGSEPSTMATPRFGIVVASLAGEKRVSAAYPVARSAAVAEELAE